MERASQKNRRSSSESALDIDVQNKSYEQDDLEHIHWISHLNYLDPNADARECTAQGAETEGEDAQAKLIHFSSRRSSINLRSDGSTQNRATGL